MKMIVAMIRSEKLEAVRTALDSLEVCPTCVSQVTDLGPEPGFTQRYRGREVHVRPTKLRLEVAVNDWLADSVVAEIVRAGITTESGQREDGKVFVLPLDACVSIRKNEPSPAANGTWRGLAYQLR